MTMPGPSWGRCRLWLVLLAALGTALFSLLALVQWDSPARADERTESGTRIALEYSAAPSFQHALAEAATVGDVDPRIVGGTAVPNGKYPFMAVMFVERSDGSTSLCGGSLIDPDSVLTAGHCFVDPETGLVDAQSAVMAVGRTVISQNQGQVRSATALFLHPGFNLARSFANDAAVLKLDAAVAGIKPIRLATARQNKLEKPGRKLTVAGWGTTSKGGSTTDRMREVLVPVVSDATALKAYRSGSYFPKLMVAASARGKDSCQGDSGGPLFKPGATRTQVGIVSFGRGCARRGFPGVYTEVNNSGIRSFIVAAAQQ